MHFIGGTTLNSTTELIANGEVEHPYEWLKESGTPLEISRIHRKAFFQSWEEIAASPVTNIL